MLKHPSLCTWVSSVSGRLRRLLQPCLGTTCPQHFCGFLRSPWPLAGPSQGCFLRVLPLANFTLSPCPWGAVWTDMGPQPAPHHWLLLDVLKLQTTPLRPAPRVTLPRSHLRGGTTSPPVSQQRPAQPCRPPRPTFPRHPSSRGAFANSSAPLPQPGLHARISGGLPGRRELPPHPHKIIVSTSQQGLGAVAPDRLSPCPTNSDLATSDCYSPLTGSTLLSTSTNSFSLVFKNKPSLYALASC